MFYASNLLNCQHPFSRGGCFVREDLEAISEDENISEGDRIGFMLEAQIGQSITEGEHMEQPLTETPEVTSKEDMKTTTEQEGMDQLSRKVYAPDETEDRPRADFFQFMHIDSFEEVEGRHTGYKRKKMPPEIVHAIDNLPHKIGLTIEDIFQTTISRDLDYDTPAKWLKTDFSCWPSKINKRLHFVWIDPVQTYSAMFPTKFDRNLKRWARYAPEHDVYLWQELQVNRLMDAVGIDMIYDKLPYQICKADLARLVIAYYFGGTPMDMELVPVVPLNFWFGNHSNGFSCEKAEDLEFIAAPMLCNQKIIQNSAYSTMKGSPILRRTIQNIFILLGKHAMGSDPSTTSTGKNGRSVLYQSLRLTGPFAFTAGIMSYFNLSSSSPILSKVTTASHIHIFRKHYGFLPFGDLFMGRIALRHLPLWNDPHSSYTVRTDRKISIHFNLPDLKKKRIRYKELLGACGNNDSDTREAYEHEYLYENWDKPKQVLISKLNSPKEQNHEAV